MEKKYKYVGGQIHTREIPGNIPKGLDFDCLYKRLDGRAIYLVFHFGSIDPYNSQ